MDSFREPPRTDYDYDVNRLVRTYERALREIQTELNSLFLSDFERAQIIAVESNIRETIKDLRKYGDDWAKQTITHAAKEGVATTIYTLGIATTFEEALKIAKFNSVNRQLVNAMIADTQTDLLAVTQNIERRTRAAVRKATADVMREKMATGVSGIRSIRQSLTKEIRRQLGSAADTAIVDAAGRRWKLSHYTEMVARTKMNEAHREASINDGIGRGIEYGVVSRHYGSCPKCSPWEGRIIAINPNGDGSYPTIDEARASGLWHPNCSHLLSMVRRLDRLPDDLRDINGI